VLVGLFAVGIVTVGTGCPQAPAIPSFAAGTGTDLGTLADGAGTSFNIEGSGGGAVERVVTTGTGGTSAFEFDDDGRVDNVTATDGSTLGLDYQSDGAINVTVDDAQVFGQSIGDIAFQIPADQAPNVKAINRAARAQDGESLTADDACTIISSNCDNLVPFVDELRPLIIQFAVEAINDPNSGIPQELLDLMAAFGLDVSTIVNTMIDQYVGQVTDFCDTWQTLLALEGNPCG